MHAKALENGALRYTYHLTLSGLAGNHTPYFENDSSKSYKKSIQKAYGYYDN